MPKLTKAQFNQLLAYCEWAEGSGVYYGNLEQFKKRHDAIVEWIMGWMK